MNCGFIAAASLGCHPEPAGSGAPAAAKDLLLRGRSFVLRVPAWQAAEHEGLAGKSGTQRDKERYCASRSDIASGSDIPLTWSDISASRM